MGTLSMQETVSAALPWPHIRMGDVQACLLTPRAVDARLLESLLGKRLLSRMEKMGRVLFIRI